MIFLDTSVIVAATSRKHPQRDRSIDRMAWVVERGAACAAHSLAELYSTLSGMPAPQRMSTIEALTVLETIEHTFQVVNLTGVEYIETIRDLSARNLFRRHRLRWSSDSLRPQDSGGSHLHP